MQKKIVLISSGQPSSNPRLLKEANALAENGYQVTVIYSFWNHWAFKADHKIIQIAKWKPILVGGSPLHHKLIYNYSRVRQKISVFLTNKLKLNAFGVFAKTRAYSELLAAAISIKADVYLAHNLGCLPIAVKAAKKHNSKCGFDAEDFHRQEVTDDQSSNDYKLSKYLEDKYFPHLNYLSCASPLIAAEYQKLYPTLQPLIINNVFPLSGLGSSPLKLETHDTMKLFWFSQTVGKKRGIEDIIKALGILNNPKITLTLLGEVQQSTKHYFLELADASNLDRSKLIFLVPIAPDELENHGSQYDIGLALEPGFCLNNKLALSNKIFTYLTAGLAIIASGTLAQELFMKDHPQVGRTFPIGDVEALAEIINHYHLNQSSLLETKKEAFELAKSELNWEKESYKLLKAMEVLVG